MRRKPVLATELLPDLVHRHMPWVTVVGFSIGVAAMLGMKWASERKGGKNVDAAQPSAMLVAMGVDVALGAVGTLAALVLAGATCGALAVAALPAALLDGVLAFGVAALLYLVTEELLVEAHEVEDTPVQTAMFFLGFIVLFTLDMFT